MHHRTLLAVTLLSVPFAALALDFSRANLPYTDVEKATPESAAISLLTGEGVVRGYDDGTFRPGQQLNRAEFLKIVIETAYSNFLDAYTGPTEQCFVDVPLDAWFMPYACFGKEKGIVSGYPVAQAPKSRWPLKPEQNVNYAEALKILSELYEYTLTHEEGDEWYSPYYRAAIEHGTALSVNLPFDAQLTRGQMARLAAAFLAESQGQLKSYRLAERGEYVASSSSSSRLSSSASSSSSLAQSSSSESSSLSSSSASSQGYTLPSANHFLVVGRKSDAIADGVVRLSEQGSIRAVEVSLFQEVKALDVLEVTTEDGTLVATLRQRTNATSPDYKQYYEVQLAPEQGFAIAANTDVRVVLRAVIRTPENNGASEQLLQVRTFKVTLVGSQTNSNTSLNLAGPFPKHQTSFGRITAVGSVNPATAQVASGTGLLLGTFTFWGEAISGKQLSVTDLVFSLVRTGTVNVKNIRLGRPGGETVSCTLGNDGVSCNAIPAATGAIGEGAALTLELRADVLVTGAAASLEASLANPGSPEALGSVWWTDQSGRFRWVEGKTSPLARGIRYQ
jgi:hypothetical protein